MKIISLSIRFIKMILGGFILAVLLTAAFQVVAGVLGAIIDPKDSYISHESLRFLDGYEIEEVKVANAYLIDDLERYRNIAKSLDDTFRGNEAEHRKLLKQFDNMLVRDESVHAILRDGNIYITGTKPKSGSFEGYLVSLVGKLNVIGENRRWQQEDVDRYRFHILTFKPSSDLETGNFVTKIKIKDPNFGYRADAFDPINIGDKIMGRVEWRHNHMLWALSGYIREEM